LAYIQKCFTVFTAYTCLNATSIDLTDNEILIQATVREIGTKRSRSALEAI